METFTEIRDFIDNPDFHTQRQQSFRGLEINTIDAPLIEIVGGFSELPYCFTLQSCYGHFLHSSQKDPLNLETLPISDSITTVEYRIAYIALCIQDNDSGKTLFDGLSRVPSIDPEYVQFGCAEWFWEKQVNSYALQVEPARYMTKDSVSVSYKEALHIQKTRDDVFSRLKKLIHKRGRKF